MSTLVFQEENDAFLQNATFHSFMGAILLAEHDLA